MAPIAAAQSRRRRGSVAPRRPRGVPASRVRGKAPRVARAEIAHQEGDGGGRAAVRERVHRVPRPERVAPVPRDARRRHARVDRHRRPLARGARQRPGQSQAGHARLHLGHTRAGHTGGGGGRDDGPTRRRVRARHGHRAVHPAGDARSVEPRVRRSRVGRRGGSQRWVRPVTHRGQHGAQPTRSSRPRRDSPAIPARAEPNPGGGGEQPTDHGRLGAQAAQGVRGQPPVRGGGGPDRAEHESLSPRNRFNRGQQTTRVSCKPASSCPGNRLAPIRHEA